MRKIVHILIVSVVLFIVYSCNIKQDKEIHDALVIISDTNYFLQAKEASPFSPALQNELNDFVIKQQDTIVKVIRLWIEDKENECILYMISDTYYDSRFLCGYTIVNNKMVAYDYIKSDDSMSYPELIKLMDSINPKQLLKLSGCCNLIDTSLLTRKATIDFPNENQVHYTYDGIGRKYLIHSPDSLELVFEGYY